MTNLNTKASTTLINNNPIKFPQETLFDDRIRVAHPDVYPYRSVGQIEIMLKDGTPIQASGSLLSDYTILTAGHVVKTADNKFKDIDTLRFIPAKNHSDLPYGIYDWMQMTAVYDGGSRDWALISLTQPAGFRTGFLGSIAKFPVDRWVTVNENDHFQHIGYPGDHVDEMWIDEEGICTGIYDRRQLKTDIDAAAGQSGGPLTINFFDIKPQVCGCLSWGENDIEEPNFFTPGYEEVMNDVWMQWLCDVYGKLHPDDRFHGCTSRLDEVTKESTGMLPNYDIRHVFTADKGPGIRRFSPHLTKNWMMPKRDRLMNQKDKKQ